MPLIHFNLLLYKIKTNLDKWEKLKLTLWGKISILDMTTVPWFDYLSSILPLTIPPNIFNKYEGTV